MALTIFHEMYSRDLEGKAVIVTGASRVAPCNIKLSHYKNTENQNSLLYVKNEPCAQFLLKTFRVLCT